jgi:hypothetical protein
LVAGSQILPLQPNPLATDIWAKRGLLRRRDDIGLPTIGVVFADNYCTDIAGDHIGKLHGAGQLFTHSEAPEPEGDQAEGFSTIRQKNMDDGDAAGQI